MNDQTIGVLQAPPLHLLTGASLFLDFDGTLVEIAETPDAVRVDDRLRALIQRLSERMNGRVAIVTGRPIDAILEFFGELPVAIAGSHGLEHRSASGVRHGVPRPAGLDEIEREMRAFAEQWPGALIETKPFGIGLHYRRNPDAEPAARALAAALAERHGLHLQTGKMVAELRATGGDKASAIGALLQEAPFAGTIPVFIGDDDTDEPGFRFAAQAGGAGILVGDRTRTDARYALPGVAETLGWLEAALAALEPA